MKKGRKGGAIKKVRGTGTDGLSRHTGKGQSSLKSQGRSKSLKQLKKELDTIFSIYVRQRDAKDGMVTCCTCRKTFPITEVHAGHYVSRKHLSLRWDEINVHGQCVGCNIFKKGNMDEYALFMVRRYGDGILGKLNAEKNKIVKLGMDYYEDMIGEYKEKIKCLAETH